MHIGVPAETRAHETRVAATPETVKKLRVAGPPGHDPERRRASASFPDDAFSAAGAEIVDAPTAFGADLVLKVQSPTEAELPLLKSRRGAGRHARSVSTPTTTRKAGRVGGRDRVRAGSRAAYDARAEPRRAVVAGEHRRLQGCAGREQYLSRFMPMLMTAAGTVKAARVLILGAGVAGLQAIATAKRLGAVIEASDVRPAVKEQIESLGAKFLDVPYETDEEREAAQGVGGYAKPMPPSWLARQAALVHERAKAGRHRHHDRADSRPSRADADFRRNRAGR
jgi:NAD(P) transhydrogenase subunit alpha